MSHKSINGFSKLSKEGKLKWLSDHYYGGDKKVMDEFISFWLNNKSVQKVLDGFSENTVSNFVMP